MNKTYKMLMVAVAMMVATVANANPYCYTVPVTTAGTTYAVPTVAARPNPYVAPVTYHPVTKTVAVQNEYTNPWRGAARTANGGWVGAPAKGNLNQQRAYNWATRKPRTTPNYRVRVVRH